MSKANMSINQKSHQRDCNYTQHTLSTHSFASTPNKCAEPGALEAPQMSLPTLTTIGMLPRPLRAIIICRPAVTGLRAWTWSRSTTRASRYGPCLAAPCCSSTTTSGARRCCICHCWFMSNRSYMRLPNNSWLRNLCQSALLRAAWSGSTTLPQRYSEAMLFSLAHVMALRKRHAH